MYEFFNPVIFAVIGSLGAVYWALRKFVLTSPPKQAEQPPPEDVTQDMFVQVDNLPSPETKTFQYACTCGDTFPNGKELGQHCFMFYRKEKGLHKSSGKVEVKPDLGVRVSTEGRYEALVLLHKAPHLMPCKLNNSCGRQMYVAPTMPFSGWKYLVREQSDGFIIDYEARDEDMVAEETPSQAFDATHWDIVDDVYSFGYSIWSDLKTWLVGALVAATFIIVLVTISD